VDYIGTSTSIRYCYYNHAYLFLYPTTIWNYCN